MLIASNHPDIKAWFVKEFAAKFNQSADSGDNTYVGIEYNVYDNGRHITLNTPRLWAKLRERIYGAGIKLPKVTTPLPSNAMDLLYADPSEHNKLIDPEEFNVREILGIIGWAVHAVRPGEVFATSLIARRAHIPTKNVISVLLHLVSYLLDHSDDKMHITADDNQIFVAASDASHANCPKTMRSWFGYCLIWGGIAFSFRSKLLPYVAPSTRDAEAGALVYCVKGMMGVLVTLEELGFLPEGVTPLRLEVDSQAAIDTLSTDWIHKDARWTAIRIAFLREFVRRLLIGPVYVNTKEMRADPLTKVPSSAVSHESDRLRLMGISPPLYTK